MAEANRPSVDPVDTFRDDSLVHHKDDDNHTYEIRMRMIQVLNII